MALSNKQVIEVVDLFANNFVLEPNSESRKRLFQRFGDVFGRGIVNWQDMVLKILEEKDVDSTLVKEYKDLLAPRQDENYGYEFREMTENDFPMVYEMLNHTFDTILTSYDNEHFKKFLTGYSFVACDKEDILGVALAYPIPGLHSDIIYVDSLAVAQYARGRGIAKKLLNTIQKKGHMNQIYCMRLITNRQLEAYQMYRHLGFQESKYVLMEKY
ncbi:MAG: GNAT family N-acetyltransferase [Eubacteriales bacterium]|nr:GNAT family N-acetyltransferase [Eubacteriales bacterium]